MTLRQQSVSGAREAEPPADGPAALLRAAGRGRGDRTADRRWAACVDHTPGVLVFMLLPRRSGAAAALAILFPLLCLLGPAVTPATAADPASAAAASAAPGDVNAVATHSGRCLEAENSSLIPGAPVEQADCTGQPGAVWRLEESPAGGGSVHLVNVNSELCLEIPNTSAGAAARQAECTGQTGASFVPVDRGAHAWLRPLGAAASVCLTVAGGSHRPGAALTVGECSAAQGVALHQRQPRIGNDPATGDPDPANCPKGSFCIYSGANQTGTLRVVTSGDWVPGTVTFYGSVFNNGWTSPAGGRVQFAHRSDNQDRTVCLEAHPGPGQYRMNAPGSVNNALSATWRGPC